ncbi:MAG: hypothetical protein AVDCRST_MAG49-4593 [uncultured Thermomicrobiales bacterium]|uniref:Uncharacterized protein n=1 Tax=uncultured Thermomicrobiales bacterium TaxID=1645740 RepID=A0A6J4VL21_9BACT|nr:MAG: hypothetical protein AVDCRST_MAG49-4593 [uncultured Thermomicrobiales bacterium]
MEDRTFTRVPWQRRRRGDRTSDDASRAPPRQAAGEVA